MVAPQAGDVILRGSFEEGFALVDATTDKLIAQDLPSLQAALELAQHRGAGTIWQQNLDMRGRPIGEPLRLQLPHA